MEILAPLAGEDPSKPISGIALALPPWGPLGTGVGVSRPLDMSKIEFT